MVEDMCNMMFMGIYLRCPESMFQSGLWDVGLVGLFGEIQENLCYFLEFKFNGFICFTWLLK